MFFLVFLISPGAFSLAAGSDKSLIFQNAYPIQAELASFKLDTLSEKEPTNLSKEKGAISTWKAVGLSVLLPGSGHWYLGNRNRAKVFFGIEAAGWGSFAGFLWFSNQREKDYQNYAVARAGVYALGKDEQFWRSLTFYENRDEYNKLGPITSANNPFYPEDASYNWQWDSPASQAQYRLLRNSSKTAHRRAIFTLALLGVERLVAAADAYRIAKKINSKNKADNLEVYFEPEPTGGRLVLIRSF